MTPVSDFRKMSLLPDMLSVARSQSDTSYDGLATALLQKRGRRCSEWVGKDDRKMILRPLQLNGGDHREHNGLLYRRLSRASPKTHPETTTPELVSRSYSVKSVKKLAESRQRHRGSSIPSDTTQSGGVKVKERTVSNRSLPLPGDETDYCRLRNFSITSKGVVNRGDSFRCKSNPRFADSEEKTVKRKDTVEDASPLRNEQKELSVPKKSYRVLLVGASGVGKSSMWKQFLTSEYICADEVSSDQEVDRAVTVILNTEESQMEFDKQTFHEGTTVFPKSENSETDAYVIVYSVTDRKSYSLARHILCLMEKCIDTKAVILCGNKTDLARLRVVSTDEGKSLAKDRGCKFIEISVVINHQVDELLVGTLSQIRIKAKVAEKLKKKRDSQSGNRRSSIYSGSKASGVLKKILRKACMKSKSCDNLHVL
ncbi:GTP-binding protein REM 2 [Parasteatoda tepidariorum]|uniref:GTP-binding protein REM 2 n=1 Tax=Parasteatoda tepidariorum TaxID=114398 RepID=UPI001C729330|nr:uncharacterized protein LOC107457420 [Parasteatoda tepidariorum]